MERVRPCGLPYLELKADRLGKLSVFGDFSENRIFLSLSNQKMNQEYPLKEQKSIIQINQENIRVFIGSLHGLKILKSTFIIEISFSVSAAEYGLGIEDVSSFEIGI